MNLLDILPPTCIKSPTVATGKREIIDELVDLLASAGKVPDAAALKDAVWAREQSRTTGVGYGLAIPHGKSPGVKELAMAIGRPPKPIDFQALDQKPVKLVVLLASPPDKPSDHIQALARVSRLMTVESLRESIYAAQTPAEIYELIKSHESR